VDAYAILKYLHVLLAITAVGANITYGIWLSRAAREPQHLAFVLKGVKVLDDRIANPAYALLFVTGIAMVYARHLVWTTPWLLLGLILYAGVVVLGLFVYTPILRRQIVALEASGSDSQEYQRLAARGTRLGVLLAVLVMIIVFLMVTKPALWV
jgi:uncharacterized membrane protein